MHSVEDAQRAVACGAEALVISNHGGRQLDQVCSTLEVLHASPALKGANVEILMDGGIRSGLDVLMALATGAKAVLIGRAYAYGLGAGGEAGVTKAFDIIRGEIAHNMRLLGCQSITELNSAMSPNTRLRPTYAAGRSPLNRLSLQSHSLNRVYRGQEDFTSTRVVTCLDNQTSPDSVTPARCPPAWPPGGRHTL